MEIQVFAFSLEGFQFLKFYEKEAKPDFKRGLAVSFEVKNS